jgi:hypothetical protein
MPLRTRAAYNRGRRFPRWPSASAPPWGRSPGLAPRPEPWIVLIPGTQAHRLEENIGAADIELSVDDLAEIDAVAAKIDVQGGCYAEAQNG